MHFNVTFFQYECYLFLLHGNFSDAQYNAIINIMGRLDQLEQTYSQVMMLKSGKNNSVQSATANNNLDNNLLSTSEPTVTGYNAHAPAAPLKENEGYGNCSIQILNYTIAINLNYILLNVSDAANKEIEKLKTAGSKNALYKNFVNWTTTSRVKRNRPSRNSQRRWSFENNPQNFPSTTRKERLPKSFVF